MGKIEVKVSEEDLSILASRLLQKSVELQIENSKLLEKLAHLEELLVNCPTIDTIS